MSLRPSSPELLSPAGDPEAMRAAVANGADAVYFGLSDFNARHRATNFTLEELPQTMQFLHEHGVRGYVTFNTLIFSDELPRALEYLATVVRAGADAVIVQDLGIVELLARLAPGFPVHGSTQMTLTEPRGIEFVRDLGVERVILARELSLKEIGRITRETPVPVEVFVHGALCVAYSGQCLTSEAIGGRSANRGQCAQACRQPYELIVDGTPRDLGDKAYLLSPQDLAAYDRISDLAALGVCSLKIEGRLKSAHYVAATTQAYRAALDAAIREQPFALAPQQELDLAQSFSRGFTHGFLDGVNHQQLVQGRFPKNRGVRVGTVVEKTAQGVVLELDEKLAAAFADSSADSDLPLKPGDGVVFDEGHPEQDEQGGRVYHVLPVRTDRSKGASLGKSESADHSSNPLRVEITFGHGAVNLAAVSLGAHVWKTDDPALRRRLERSFTTEDAPQRSGLTVVVQGTPGEPLRARFTDDSGHTVEVSSDGPLEAARKHPLTVQLLQEQFGRLGGTPFHLAEVQLQGPEGPLEALPVMAPKSVLNELRRQAIARLIELRRAPPERSIHLTALQDIREEIRQRWSVAAPTPDTSPRLSVLCRTLEQLEAVLDWSPPEGLAPAEHIYCDFEEVRLFKQAVSRARETGAYLALATPRIIKPGEEGLLLQIARCQPAGVLIRNLAALTFYREKYPELDRLGDYTLNVANELTADLFARQGLKTLTPSYDLNLQQLEALLGRINPALFEVVLHQHVPMFHMEHCVFSHTLSNGKDFHDCGRPCDRHRVDLKDHVGEAHPLMADVGCRNTVFNARAQSAAPYVPRLLERGVRRFRVELLREDREETQTLLTSYARVLAGLESGPQMWRELRVLNQVGLTRGTLEFA